MKYIFISIVCFAGQLLSGCQWLRPLVQPAPAYYEAMQQLSADNIDRVKALSLPWSVIQMQPPAAQQVAEHPPAEQPLAAAVTGDIETGVFTVDIPPLQTTSATGELAAYLAAKERTAQLEAMARVTQYIAEATKTVIADPYTIEANVDTLIRTVGNPLIWALKFLRDSGEAGTEHAGHNNSGTTGDAGAIGGQGGAAPTVNTDISNSVETAASE